MVSLIDLLCHLEVMTLFHFCQIKCNPSLKLSIVNEKACDYDCQGRRQEIAMMMIFGTNFLPWYVCVCMCGVEIAHALSQLVWDDDA